MFPFFSKWVQNGLNEGFFRKKFLPKDVPRKIFWPCFVLREISLWLRHSSIFAAIPAFWAVPSKNPRCARTAVSGLALLGLKGLPAQERELRYTLVIYFSSADADPRAVFEEL